MNTPINQQLPPDMTTAVLDRIKSERITPRGKVVFLLANWGMWLLWGVTVLFGALAVAVTLYIAMSAEYSLFEATHENFFTFVLEVLPYVWLILFVVMTTVAITQVRHTKRGYRYRTSTILGSSLFLSLLGGGAFHVAGLGYTLDQILGHQVAYYMSLEKMDLKMWQMPESGRLVGALVPRPDMTQSDTPLVFEDVRGVRWEVRDSELTDRELQLLMNTKRVRLLGTSTQPGVFHICGVFPWMFERMMARHEMEAERTQFDARMAEHRRMLDLEAAKPQPDGDSKPIPSDHICAHLEMMGRMGR